MIDQPLADELHGRLLAELERLEGVRQDLHGDSSAPTFLLDEEQDVVDQHPADEGSELFEREKNMTLEREIEATIGQVREALARWDAGTYGACARCGKPIPAKRLEAIPEAIYDVECQAIIERERQHEYQGANNS